MSVGTAGSTSMGSYPCFFGYTLEKYQICGSRKELADVCVCVCVCVCVRLFGSLCLYLWHKVARGSVRGHVCGDRACVWVCGCVDVWVCGCVGVLSVLNVSACVRGDYRLRAMLRG